VFTGRDLAAVMVEHLSGQPDLSGLAELELAVLRRALAKDPRQRFPSCRAFVQVLGDALCRSIPEILAAGAKARPAVLPLDPQLLPDRLQRVGGKAATVAVGRGDDRPNSGRSDQPPARRTALLEVVPIGTEPGRPDEPDASNASTPTSPEQNLPTHPDFQGPPSRRISTRVPLAPPQPAGPRMRVVRSGLDFVNLALLGMVLGVILYFIFGTVLPVYRANAVRHHVIAGRYAEALELLDVVPAPAGADVLRQEACSAWLARATALLDAGRFDEAEATARALLARFPDDTDAAACLERALARVATPRK
jgi:hypothetical protein